MSDSKHKYNKEALIKEMKKKRLPEGYRLEASSIIIEVGGKEYGVVCECGNKEFSEDGVFSKLFCSMCSKLLAVRSVEAGWITEEEG